MHSVGREAGPRWALQEALGMCALGGVERGLAGCGDAAVEGLGRCEQGEADVMMMVIVPGEEVAEPGAAVENWASLYGLALETRGRLKLRDAPSESRSCARGSLFIADPRSAWTLVAVSEGIACCWGAR